MIRDWQKVIHKRADVIMKRLKVYIAGPMRGIIDFNYPRFNSCAQSLREIGWDVVNPAEIGAKYGTPEQINANPELLKLVTNIELFALKSCDAIFMLEGWNTSQGAKNELAAAIAAGLEVYVWPTIAVPHYEGETWRAEP